jgi:hypothetical protein
MRFHLSRGLQALDYLIEEPRDLPVYAERLHVVWYSAFRAEKMSRQIESTVIHRLHHRGFSKTEITRLTRMTDNTFHKRFALGEHLQREGKYVGYWED